MTWGLWHTYIRRRKPNSSPRRASRNSSQSGIWLHSSPTLEKDLPDIANDHYRSGNWSIPSLGSAGEVFVAYDATRSTYHREPSWVPLPVAKSATSSHRRKSLSSHGSKRSQGSTASQRTHRSERSHGSQGSGRSDGSHGGSHRSHRTHGSEDVLDPKHYQHHHRDNSVSSSHRSNRSNRSNRSQRSDLSSHSKLSDRSGNAHRSHRSKNSFPGSSSAFEAPSMGTTSLETSPETPENRPQIVFGTLTPMDTPSGSSNASNSAPAAANWNRNRHGPLHSLLGSSYSRSEVDDAKRQTNLPPYTPGINGTFVPGMTTSSSEGSDARICFPTASEEKAGQLRRMLEAAKSETSLTTPPAESSRPSMNSNPSIKSSSCAVPLLRSGTRQAESNVNGHRHSIADRSSAGPSSDVMSVYGQPPSERRDSSMTAITVQSGLDSAVLPGMLGLRGAGRPTGQVRPSPRVITDIAHRHPGERTLLTAGSSAIMTSAQPLVPNRGREGFQTASKGHAHQEEVAETPVSGGLFDVNLDHDLDLSFERKPANVPSAWNGNGSSSRSGNEGMVSVGRKKSATAMSQKSGISVSTARSAARPDSDVIPFEEFYNGVRAEGR